MVPIPPDHPTVDQQLSNLDKFLKALMAVPWWRFRLAMRLLGRDVNRCLINWSEGDK